MMILDLDRLTAAHLAVAIRIHYQACRRQHVAVPAALRDLENVAVRASRGTEGQPMDVGAFDAEDGFMSTPILLDTAELAARLTLSERRVKQLIASGELKSVTIGRSRRVALDDFEEFIDQLRAEGGTAA